MDDWIKNIKFGDEVLTFEFFTSDDEVEIYKWKSEVVAVEKSYIETKYVRARRLEWDKYPRNYATQYVKNYFAPDGTINIEPIIE